METQKESKSAKAGLKFPVSRLQRYFRAGNYSDRIGSTGAVFTAAVLEYLVAEIVELSGHAAKANKKVRITPRHLFLAIKKDSELNELLKDVTIAEGGVLQDTHLSLANSKTKVNKSNASVDGGSQSF